jgi:hypothetical protein
MDLPTSLVFIPKEWENIEFWVDLVMEKNLNFKISDLG